MAEGGRLELDPGVRDSKAHTGHCAALPLCHSKHGPAATAAVTASQGLAQTPCFRSCILPRSPSNLPSHLVKMFTFNKTEPDPGWGPCPDFLCEGCSVELGSWNRLESVSPSISLDSKCAPHQELSEPTEQAPLSPAEFRAVDRRIQQRTQSRGFTLQN